MLKETCSSFIICGSCYALRGTWLYKGNLLQQDCHHTCPTMREKYRLIREGLLPATARWPLFDFNEVGTLCYCCGAEVLDSGSRWSNWFCDECNKRVRDLNTRHQRCVIPVGRHSLMNGVGLIGKNALIPEAQEQFLFKARGLFASQTLLEEWAAAIVAETARTRGFQEGADVPLLDYLNALARNPVDKEQTFKRLCAYFQSPVKAQTQVGS